MNEKITYNNGLNLNDTHIGKYMTLLVTPNAHPYLKFTKVWPSDGVEYKCEFSGKFTKIFNDKYEQGMLLEFDDVDFPLRKKHKTKGTWKIYRKDILEFKYLHL